MTTQVQEAPAPVQNDNAPNPEAAAALDLSRPQAPPDGNKPDASGRLHGEGGRFVAKSRRSPEEQAAFDKDWTEKLFGKSEPTLPSLAAKEVAKLDAEQAEAQPESEETPVETTKDTAAYNKAVKVLEFDGYEKSDLDKLGEERVIALASKRSKVQSDVSAKLQRLAVFEKQPATNGKEPQAKVGEPAAQGLDFTEIVKPFADEYGEEAGKALSTIAQKIVGAIEPRAQRAEAVAEAFALREARAELRERFPDLADESKYGEVLSEMRLQVKRGYDSMGALMQASARVLGLKEVNPDQAPDNSKARRNGKPMAQNQGQPNRMRSAEDRRYAAFLALDGRPITPDSMAAAIQASRGG